jgi:hypothetical protein
MTITTAKRITKRTIKSAAQITLTLAILGLAGKITWDLITINDAYQETRKNAICPALFSISRSARDTLIVMKAEPLCNTFILENLN